MLWLIITVCAYLILAVVFLVDKHLLSAAIPNPKVYVFYVGTLGMLILLLIPFVGFYVPSPVQIILALSAGLCFIFSLYWFYKALNLFEASRVVPAVGALTPVFTFFLVYLISAGQESLTKQELAAFILLVLGSLFIVLKKDKMVNRQSLKISSVAAFFMALSFVLTKYVYLGQEFWNGFIWRSIGGFLMALLFFILFPEIKKEIFAKKPKEKTYQPKKTAFIFLTNQAAGASAAILQNWAIALAPLAYVAFINALQGVQYAFLLLLAVILSLKFPQILKEEISSRILFQKIFAIGLIIFGLALLALA